jgi:hypothetical protein
MANTTTLLQMQNRVRQRADMENTLFVSDAEIITYLNDGLSELNDLFITEYEEYVVQEKPNLQLLGGTSEYDIVADFGITDFMKILGIDLKVGSRAIALKRFMFSERNFWTMPNAPWDVTVTPYRYSVRGNKIYFFPTTGIAGTVSIWYIPQYEPMVLEADQINDFLPYLNNGWEEYAVITAAIKCLQKEESDTQPLLAEKGIQLKRINDVAKTRDVGNPDRIAYVNTAQSEWWW